MTNTGAKEVLCIFFILFLQGITGRGESRLPPLRPMEEESLHCSSFPSNYSE